MKPNPPIRIGDPGISPTHGGGGGLGGSGGVAGTMTPAAAMAEDRGSPGLARTRGRRSRSQWLETLTSVRACAAVVGLSLVFWIVSGVVGSKFLGKRIRGAEEQAMAALAGGPAIPEAELEALRRDGVQARARLIADGQELKSVLERIESDARQRGWQVDRRLSTPVGRPGGVEGLIAYPVVLHLAPVRSDAIPGFGSLIEWLNGISAGTRHAAVTGLSMGTNDKQRGWVRVELQVLGVMVNDQAVPE